MQRRGTEDPSGQGVYPNWAWSWPANRRVLYNRASCDPSGKPWDPDARQVWWNESRKMGGQRCPDFKADSNPKDHMGPFIMNPEGVGRIFAPLAAFADGPFPEHYEPIESPVQNALHPKQSNNPVVKKFKTRPWTSTARRARASTSSAPPTGSPSIITTGPRTIPMNVQLVPEPFVEIPVELADELGIKGGDKVKVTSARSYYIAKAMVTQAHQADDDRRQEGLPDRHSHPPGLSRHSGRRGQGRKTWPTALAHRGRSQRLHARIQGLSGETGESV
jgi:formate dehydrogenase major subunit